MLTTLEMLIRESAELEKLRNMQTNLLKEAENLKKKIKALEDRLVVVVVEENKEVIKFLRSTAFPNMAEDFPKQVKLMVEWYLTVQHQEKAKVEPGNESLTSENPGTSKSFYKNQKGHSSGGSNVITQGAKFFNLPNSAINVGSEAKKRKKASEAKNSNENDSGVKNRKINNDDNCKTGTQELALGLPKVRKASPN